MDKPIITRIAPSPTGTLHVGTARSALFNYLFAKANSGTFIVRIEDTDKERSKPEFEKDILSGLEKLGIKVEKENIYKQSEREELYTSYINKLIEGGNAYVSKEKSKADETKEVEIVRLKNPGKKITFTDEIRGEITFDTTELKDFVIARSVTEPLYHLAVVIDDYEMGITHVIRGDDHISNTPRQILIQEALSIERPIYAHMPLILAPDKSKLSKRNGAVSITEYLKNYRPKALVNYLALLGWNPGTEQEFFDMEGLIEVFDLSKMQKGGAIFSTEKLDSINHHYLRNISVDDYYSIIKEHAPKNFDGSSYSENQKNSMTKVIQEKAKTYLEITEILENGSMDFYSKTPEIDISKLVWKKASPENTKKHLEFIYSALTNLTDTFSEENIKRALWDYATEMGRADVLWPLRVCLTGLDKSPDPFSVASAIGKEETLSRVKSAINSL